jgi:hypothetical protein
LAAASVNSPDCSSVRPITVGTRKITRNNGKERREHHHDRRDDGAGVAQQLARVLGCERGDTMPREF